MATNRNDSLPLNIQNNANNVHNCQLRTCTTCIIILMIGNWILNIRFKLIEVKNVYQSVHSLYLKVGLFCLPSMKEQHFTAMKLHILDIQKWSKLTVDESENLYYSKWNTECFWYFFSESNKLEFSNSIFNYQNLNVFLLAIKWCVVHCNLTPSSNADGFEYLKRNFPSPRFM